jgi:diamine N-acetyltransferase
MISIKRALISDAAVISFLGKRTFSETFADLFDPAELETYLDDTFNIKKLERSLLKDRNIFGILFYNDKAAGYFKVKVGTGFENSIDEKYCQLQKIYILKDYLHLKLGKPLLDSIYSMKEIAACKIMWLVVLQTNYRAIKFNEKQGFEKLRKYYHTIGSQKLEYELMTKDLLCFHRDFRPGGNKPVFRHYEL